MLRHVAGYALAARGVDKRTLQAFMGHRSIASELDFDPEQRFVWDWVKDHGQSLDWILSGDPGGMIARGAARQHETDRAA
jgi:hypothetical protein